MVKILARYMLDDEPAIMPAVLSIFGSYTDFERWLESQHTCTAARAFDVRITKKLVRDTASFFGSAIMAGIIIFIKKAFDI